MHSVRLGWQCPFDNGEGYEEEDKDLNGNACPGSPGMGTVGDSGHRKVLCKGARFGTKPSKSNMAIPHCRLRKALKIASKFVVGLDL